MNDDYANILFFLHGKSSIQLNCILNTLEFWNAVVPLLDDDFVVFNKF